MKTSGWLMASLLMAGTLFAQEMVTVTGQSAISEKEAIRDALRTAVERAGGMQIASWSTVENFQLAQDIIKTRADGIVGRRDIIKSEKALDGTFTVTMKCEVLKEKLDATWAEVEMLMEQLGEPTIMLFFDDLKQHIGQPEPSLFSRMSPVTNQISRQLKDAGFRVIERSRFELMQKNNVKWAEADNRVDLMTAEARSTGADIFIEGFAVAEGPTRLPESGLNQWKTTVSSKAFWADSAELIFATDLASNTKNFRDPGDTGAIELLNFTAKEASAALKFELLQKLSRQAQAGGYLMLEISNAGGERKYTIEDLLKTVEGIQSVKLQKQYEGGVVFEVRTTLQTSSLIRVLERMDFAGFRLELNETRGQTIVLTARDSK